MTSSGGFGIGPPGLPREFAELIGTPATIYQTRCKDSTAFVVVLDDEGGNPSKEKVGQLRQEVGQPKGKKVFEDHISALEKEINALRSSLLLNEDSSLHHIEKSKAEGEIRTRVVASTGP